jgi:hypothetical protein
MGTTHGYKSMPIPCPCGYGTRGYPYPWVKLSSLCEIGGPDIPLRRTWKADVGKMAAIQSRNLQGNPLLWIRSKIYSHLMESNALWMSILNERQGFLPLCNFFAIFLDPRRNDNTDMYANQWKSCQLPSVSLEKLVVDHEQLPRNYVIAHELIPE